LKQPLFQTALVSTKLLSLLLCLRHEFIYMLIRRRIAIDGCYCSQPRGIHAVKSDKKTFLISSSVILEVVSVGK
jgi:hypothetical protein